MRRQSVGSKTVQLASAGKCQVLKIEEDLKTSVQFVHSIPSFSNTCNASSSSSLCPTLTSPTQDLTSSPLVQSDT